jgi:ubiquinone/menaquinone biosynthesis C-methylase UbiE
MTNNNDYIKKLLESYPLREPVLRSAIQALQLPHGSRGLDAGCGIGQLDFLLADAVGPEGHITGIDIVPEFISLARTIVEDSEFSAQISYQEGNLFHLPFDNNTIDWAWSCDCVGYPTGNILAQLKELARVVKPGGTVAVAAWSSQNLLPGYPLLEARLNSYCSSYVPIVKGKKPELNFLRALGWFRKAGFEASTVKTFVGDIHAPLDDAIRTALISFFEMLWGEPQRGEPEIDRADYLRLCQPDSPEFILNHPEYYAFFTYSMFWGKVPFEIL